MQDPETRNQNIALAKNSPSLFLQGETPKLIDEWQTIPFIWDAIRFEIDRRDAFGQFILTGSAVPADNSSILHSGIGRITQLTMRPMSLFESLDSNGCVSLSDLFLQKDFLGGKNEKNLEEYAYLVCRGGWPKAAKMSRPGSLDLALNYYEELVQSDISRFDGIKRNPSKIQQLLRSLARNTATEASLATILKDMQGTTSENTLSSYINALQGLFVIENLSAWNPNLRSTTAIRTSPTRHFVDPSIATAALGIEPNGLINDLKTFGFLFESLCIRNLRVYAEKIDGTVEHYRDKNGLEADAVIHLRNGAWASIEVKLRDSERINEGAEHLKKLASSIDQNKMPPPAFLMVLTATDVAYKRNDGVFVVPIGCLKD